MDRLPDIRRSNPSSDDNDRLMERWIKQKAAPCRPCRSSKRSAGRSDGSIQRHADVLCGVDVDRTALEIRKYEKGDLDEIIEGDLRTVRLDDHRFDVIYCSFVLEHVERADLVLENFVRWLKPEGLLIVRIQDPRSVRGFVTRITPHWFHVLYYKRVMRRPSAGQPGHAPYATFYHPRVSRRGIYGYCAAHGFRVMEEHGEHQPDGEGVVRAMIGLGTRIVAALSLGTLTAGHANLLYILEKAPAADPAGLAESLGAGAAR